jgi:hypothetical protein
MRLMGYRTRKNLAVLLCQLVIGTTLLVAAVRKVLDSPHFVEALIATRLPHRVTLFLAWTIPVLEISLAVLLLGFSAPAILLPSFILATAMLLSFTLWMVWVYHQGLEIECGCFGAGGRTVGAATLLRNSLLLIVSTVGAVLTTASGGPLPASLWFVITATAIGAAVALVLAAQSARPALVLSHRQLFDSTNPEAGG